MKNYYEILEVNQKASKEIIEKAYKTLTKKYHPDLYSTTQKIEAENKMKELNEAYKILSDDFLREQYNMELKREIERQKEVEKQREIEKIRERQIARDNIYNNINMYKNNVKQQANEINEQEKPQENNTGTLNGILDILKDIGKSILPSSGQNRRVNKPVIRKPNFLALLITIIIVLIIGAILWVIPFTNGWMRELLFENPVFNLIGKLFS